MSPESSVGLAVEPESTPPGALALEPVVFEDGIFGFPNCHSFLLMATSREGLYRLQSTEHEALCFLVADPFRFFRGYVVDLPATDVARLGAAEPSDIALVVTVTLPQAAGRVATANLQGPIAINLKSRRGRQVVLNKPAWDLREPMELPAGIA